MLSATGTLTVEPHKGRIVLDISPDFVEYYAYFITRKYWVHVNTPLHGSHITIANTKFHKNINWDKAIYWDKKVIDFLYDPYIIEGGYMKGFIMYYLRISSKKIDKIKVELDIVENSNWKGLHITLGNLNKAGTNPRLWWPNTITIK
jgi:hypothetical protein